MRTMTMTVVCVLALAVAVSGCDRRGEGDAAGDTGMSGADTTLTTREVQDTTIVRTDTTVRVDTIKKAGGARTSDTAAKTRRP